MAIVLNEYNWAENAILTKTLGKKPYETLLRVAKYYVELGCTKRETKLSTERFLLSCEPSASLVTWGSTIDAAVKNAWKYPLIMIDKISISTTELEKIHKLSGIQTQRLAFTLLCVAKYMNIVSAKNEYWVNTPDNELMRMANINTSIKRQSMMFAQMKDAGLIRFSKKVDNLSVQVLFVDNTDEALAVRDFRNLGYQYMAQFTDGYFTCDKCGVTEKDESSRKKGRPRCHCKDCANAIKAEQTLLSARRRRENDCA